MPQKPVHYQRFELKEVRVSAGAKKIRRRGEGRVLLLVAGRVAGIRASAPAGWGDGQTSGDGKAPEEGS